MNPLAERIIGIALVIAAVLGLIFNIAGLVLVPRFERAVLQSTTNTLAIWEGTLETTDSGLVILDASLDNTIATMNSVEATTRGVARTVEDTSPLLETLATLTGEELPATVEQTQLSLAAAQDGIATLELLLFTLGEIPLLNLPLYNPPVPLTESLAEVSGSLTPMVDSFQEIERSVTEAETNLGLVQEEIDTLANNLNQIDRTIVDAKGVVSQYKQVVSDQREVIGTLRQSALPGITWGSRILSMILLWLAIAQVGLLSQGLEMIGRSRKRALA